MYSSTAEEILQLLDFSSTWFQSLHLEVDFCCCGINFKSDLPLGMSLICNCNVICTRTFAEGQQMRYYSWKVLVETQNSDGFHYQKF